VGSRIVTTTYSNILHHISTNSNICLLFGAICCCLLIATTLTRPQISPDKATILASYNLLFHRYPPPQKQRWGAHLVGDLFDLHLLHSTRANHEMSHHTWHLLRKLRCVRKRHVSEVLLIRKYGVPDVYWSHGWTPVGLCTKCTKWESICLTGTHTLTGGFQVSPHRRSHALRLDPHITTESH
jgi:hypothetical protein